MAANPDDFGLAIKTALRTPESKLNERVKLYQIALAIRPNNAVCYNNLGNALKDMGEID